MPIEAKIICTKCRKEENDLLAIPDEDEDYFTVDIPSGWKILEGNLICRRCIKEYKKYTKNFWVENKLNQLFGNKSSR